MVTIHCVLAGFNSEKPVLLSCTTVNEVRSWFVKMGSRHYFLTGDNFKKLSRASSVVVVCTNEVARWFLRIVTNHCVTAAHAVAEYWCYALLYAHIHTCMNNIYTHIYVCTHICAHTHTRQPLLFGWACRCRVLVVCSTRTFIHAYLKYTYICMHTYICTFTHTRQPLLYCSACRCRVLILLSRTHTHPYSWYTRVYIMYRRAYIYTCTYTHTHNSHCFLAARVVAGYWYHTPHIHTHTYAWYIDMCVYI